MKIIAFNGSPRKQWNTATLLNSALKGAASLGAEIELIHLYDLTYKGCISCFSCKTKGSPSYGRCAMHDELTPFLNKVEEADALILGSPIYFGEVSGEMRSFMERLMFPFSVYTKPYQSLFPRRIKIGVIYSGNITPDRIGFYDHLHIGEKSLGMVFGEVTTLFCFDTYQFADYSKVVADRFDPEQKARWRKEEFPRDREKAFQMGVHLVSSPS